MTGPSPAARYSRSMASAVAALGALAVALAAVAPLGAQVTGGATGATGAPAGELTVVSVDVSDQPLVRIVAAPPSSLGGQPIDGSSFRVDEQGHSPVLTVRELPADDLEIALVIDTSGSMTGAALTAAKAAARSLVGQLPPTAPVTVIGFGAAPKLLSARTTDRGATAAAIEALEAGGQTALYDAVALALTVLTGPPPGVPQTGAGPQARRSVVLLSDGGDTGSAALLDDVARALAAAAVPVFAVELATAEGRSQPLADLASATGGRVAPASDPASLQGVFDGIVRQLVRQFEITWTTTARGSVEVAVTLQTPGGRADGRARLALEGAAPATVARPADRPQPTVAVPGSSRSWALTAGLGLVAAALLAASVPMLALHTPRSRALGGGRRASAGRAVSGFADWGRSVADRALSGASRGPALHAALERAGLDLRPSELVLMTGAAGTVLGLGGALFSSPAAGLAGAVAAPVAAWGALRVLAYRRREQFVAQLGDTLQTLSGALRAGYGLNQALDVVAREAEAPTASEFRRVVIETRLGREQGEAMEAMAARTGSEDLRWVVQAFEIHRGVGGDLAEVLDNVAGTIRERNRVRRQVRTLSAEGRLSAIVLFLLPVGLALAMRALEPTYLGELTGSGQGLAMLGVAGGLLLVGGVWLHRIVKPDF